MTEEAVVEPEVINDALIAARKSVARIFATWRRVRRKNKDISDDLICILHSDSTIAFKPRTEAVSTLLKLRGDAGLGASEKVLLEPAASHMEPHSPNANAVWVLCREKNGRTVTILHFSENGVSDSGVETNVLVELIESGLDRNWLWVDPPGHVALYGINPFFPVDFAIGDALWKQLLGKLDTKVEEVGPLRSARSIALTEIGMLISVIVGNAVGPTEVRSVICPEEYLEPLFGSNYLAAFRRCREEDALVETVSVHRAWMYIAHQLGIPFVNSVAVDPGPGPVVVVAGGDA
jgi:hypothetical protein